MTEIESVTDDQSSSEKAQLPDTEVFRLNQVGLGAPAGESTTERVTVFNSLVTADDDIVGLVAYSIYKQHENDWLVAFRKTKGREPNEAELTAFTIGEGTSRRLSTYRHLAEATLAGRGPQVAATSPAAAFVQRSYAAAARNATGIGRRPDRPGLPNSILYIALAVVVVCGLLLAVKFGMSGGSKP